jgi:hypothetical protein
MKATVTSAIDHSAALQGANLKLGWAKSRHEAMNAIFEAFAVGGGDPDERRYGIRFHRHDKPAGLISASFIVERPMPDEMGLLSADLVHNTRVALDHVLTALKARFGGDPGRGGFPVCKTTDDWDERVLRPRKGPLDGLVGTPAWDFIHGEQPFLRDDPSADPLMIVNALDNYDKHRFLRPAFVYVGEKAGLDLIEVVDSKRVKQGTSRWVEGEPLAHGTTLATFLTRPPWTPHPVRARRDARISFATGEVGEPRIAYADMIERVRTVVTAAAELIASSES